MDRKTSNTVCGYNMDFDYLTSTPKHYLTILLKYAVPKEFIWDEAMKKMIDNDSLSIIQLGEKEEEQRQTRVAGSTSEGLAIPDYIINSTRHGQPMQVGKADVDKLHIYTNTYYFKLPYEYNEQCSGQILRIENHPDLPPNYAFIVPTEEFKMSRKIKGQPVETKYFANTILKESVQSFGKMLGSAKLLSLSNKPNKFQEMFRNMTLHGPAATTEHPITGDRDTVPVLLFSGWPDCARDWAVRKRVTDWPTQRIIDRVVLEGYYMAGVGRKGSETQDEEWRYSFNQAEKILAHSLTKSQRQVYVYLKLLRKFYLSQPAVFASYWMKTFFFWTCEKVPKSAFESSNLSHLMLYLFDELIHIASTGRLYNYFVPYINMLATVSRQHLATLVQNLRYVKANLIHCILHTDAKISFLAMNRAPHQKLNVIFAEVLQAVKQHPHDGETFKSTVRDGLKRLLGFYLWQIQQLRLFNDELEIERHAYRNVRIELIREVLYDLHSFCDCRATQDEMDFVHLLEQIKDPPVLAVVLVLLQIQGSKGKFQNARNKLLIIIDKTLVITETQPDAKDNEIMRDIKKSIESFPVDILNNVSNEILYRIRSVRLADTIGAPHKQQLQHECKTM